jgi:hypothetical protein
VAEGARLESVYTLTGIVGSNPTLSASLFVFNGLDAVHTVVHTVKPIFGAVCDTIRQLPHSWSNLRKRPAKASSRMRIAVAGIGAKRRSRPAL